MKYVIRHLREKLIFIVLITGMISPNVLAQGSYPGAEKHHASDTSAKSSMGNKSARASFNRVGLGNKSKVGSLKTSQTGKIKSKFGNGSVSDQSSQFKLGYQIDLAYVKCRKIWYHAIGNHDLVIMDLTAYDTANGEAQTAVISFKCRSEQIKPIKLERLFGPQALKGDVRIIGNFTVTHPQKFQNVRAAMQRYANASGEAAKMIATASGDPTAIMISKVGGMDEINKIRGDVMTEVLLIAGRIGCGGNNPLTWTKAIDVTLTPQFLKQQTNKEYKIWYASEGRKAKTCWRTIKYDVVTRITRQNIPTTQSRRGPHLNRFKNPGSSSNPGGGFGKGRQDKEGYQDQDGYADYGQGGSADYQAPYYNTDAGYGNQSPGYSSEQGPLQGDTPWYKQ
ncbi:MAG: hypothetical protein V3R49_01815 [Gammaproteobacteria bacterium]